MQVGEINSGPCLAKHAIVDPTEDGQSPDGSAAQAQAIDALIANSERKIN